jgi:amidohydrolase
MAATDNFSLTFAGRGCHGAFPHLGRDPIVTAAEAVLNVQQLVSREIDPTEPVVVTVGRFQAGTAVNVIPDSATVEGTARTLTDASRRAVRIAMQRRCAAIAQANDCDLRFEWIDGYPCTVNDPGMADYVGQTARKALGADHFLVVARPSMGGEDFAYYLQAVPGCFFFVGVQPEGHAASAPLHSDRFDFSDAALPVAMRMFLELVLNFPH